MSADKAEEIIKRAMADRGVYDAMAARENEVWGKILPDLERSEAAIEEMQSQRETGGGSLYFIFVTRCAGKKTKI